jgi:hypothetical protein
VPPQPRRSWVLRGQPHLEYLVTSALFLLVPRGTLMLESGLAEPLLARDGRRTTGLLRRASMNVGELPPVAPPSHHPPLSTRLDA